MQAEHQGQHRVCYAMVNVVKNMIGMTLLTRKNNGIQNKSVKLKKWIQTGYSKRRLETICEVTMKATYKLV